MRTLESHPVVILIKKNYWISKFTPKKINIPITNNQNLTLSITPIKNNARIIQQLITRKLN